MFRLSIITQKAWANIGITAIENFLECLPQDEAGNYDVIQELTAEMLTKIKLIKPQPIGFTANYKEQFVNIFQKMKIGEKFLLSQQVYICSSNQDLWFLVIKLINRGYGIKKAHKTAKKVLRKKKRCK